MDRDDPVVRYLLAGRDALAWKLEGLSERDLRRPLTPTSTNLLGLAKHVGSVVAEYVTLPFGRPAPLELPWSAPGAEPGADLWVPADEPTSLIMHVWTTAWAEVDAAVAELSWGSSGEVPWWGPTSRHTTFGRILVHCVAEVHRHAGHADIVRELIDGSVGWAAGNENLPESCDWPALHARVQAAADAASAADAR